MPNTAAQAGGQLAVSTDAPSPTRTSTLPTAPMVPGWPIVGSMWAFKAQPVEFLVDHAANLGPVFRVRAMGVNVTVVTGQHALDLVRTAHEGSMHRRGIFDAFATEACVDIFGVQGEQHQELRKLIRLGYSRQVAAQFTGDMAERLVGMVKGHQRGEQVPILELASRMVLDCIMTALTPVDLRPIVPDVVRFGDAVMYIVTRMEVLAEQPDLKSAVGETWRPASLPEVQTLRFSPGDTIVEQGAAAQHFHIILSGTAGRWREDGDGTRRRLGTVHPGQSFGEVGLMKGKPRIFGVIADTPVRAVRLSRQAFASLLADSDLMDHELGLVLQQRLVQAALAEALPSLDPHEVLARAPEFQLRHFSAGEVILRQGDPADRFFILASGRVDVLHAGPAGDQRHLTTLGPGAAFGEIGILQRRPRMATVQACSDTDVTVMTLERAQFEAIVASSPAAMADLSMIMCRRLMHGIEDLRSQP